MFWFDRFLCPCSESNTSYYRTSQEAIYICSNKIEYDLGFHCIVLYFSVLSRNCSRLPFFLAGKLIQA